MRLTRLTLLFVAVALALPATAHAQPASVSLRVPGPMPKLGEGTRIRVWSEALRDLRVLSQLPEYYEGTFIRWDGDSLTFEMDEPVATVANVELGRMRTENTVPIAFVSHLERQRIGTTPRRLRIGLALGALAGGALAVGMDECGADRSCSAGERAAGGVVTLAVVTAAVAVRRFWEEVPLPGR